MKKLVLVFLVVLLSLTCACGATAGNVSAKVTDSAVTDGAATVIEAAITAVAEPAAKDTAAPETTAKAPEVPAATEKPAATETSDAPCETAAVTGSTPTDNKPAEPDPPAEETTGTKTDAKTTAMNYIGKQAGDLYAAIGYPSSSDYAPSCLGDGEDGNLYYDGFVVYTFKQGESETISYVE